MVQENWNIIYLQTAGDSYKPPCTTGSYCEVSINSIKLNFHFEPGSISSFLLHITCLYWHHYLIEKRSFYPKPPVLNIHNSCQPKLTEINKIKLIISAKAGEGAKKELIDEHFWGNLFQLRWKLIFLIQIFAFYWMKTLPASWAGNKTYLINHKLFCNIIMKSFSPPDDGMIIILMELLYRSSC